MAVAVRAKFPATTTVASSSASTTVTQSVTAVAGDLIVAFVNVNSGSDGALNCSATANGVASDSTSGEIHSNTQTAGFQQGFAWFAPAGGTYNVVATASGGTPSQMGMKVLCLSGTDNATVLWETFAFNDTTLRTAMSIISDVVPVNGLGVAGFCGGAGVSSTGQTTEWNQTIGGTSAANEMAGCSSAGAGSTITFTATMSAGDWWAAVSAVTQEPSGATGGGGGPAQQGLRPPMPQTSAGVLGVVPVPAVMRSWTWWETDSVTTGPQAYTSDQTASVGFSTLDNQAIGKALAAAALSFTGTATRRLARALTASLSFTGTLGTQAVHLFTQALTAALSFTGAQAKRISAGKSATVGFTGAETDQTAKGLTAAVSFTGSQERRSSKALTGTVSFTGAQARRVGHAMQAAVSFTGSLATAAVHVFTQAFTATIGFTGNLATLAVHVFTKALTATVGFTGTVARRTGRGVSATVGFTVAPVARRIGSRQAGAVGFTGNLPRRIGRGLTAAVGFVAGLAKTGSAQVAPYIELEAPTRVGTLTAPSVKRTLVAPGDNRTLTAPADVERKLTAPAARRTLVAPEVD